MSRLIDVYPYRQQKGTIEFFIAKRATGKIYAGQWRMIGGKVEESETSWEAALREVEEELAVTPIYFWAPPTVNQFYEPKTDTIHQIPVFAAKIKPGDDKFITLDDEHFQYKWITIDNVDRYIKWPEQRRIMKLIQDILLSDVIIEDWEIPINR